METSSAAPVSLKLLVDTKENRVLFAEAGKDFVDFLFNLLQLPVGTVVSLLTEQTTVGTLGNLYESVQNLKESYFQSNQTKESLLNPKVPFSATQVPLLKLDASTSMAKRFYACPSDCLYVAHDSRAVCPSCRSSLSREVNYVEAPNPVLKLDASTSMAKRYYTCRNSYRHSYVAHDSRAVCPSCGGSLSREVNYVEAPNEVAAVGEGGLVKGVVTYMVMDDLVVTPMSTISGITMLNKFNVKEVGALEERVVDFGMSEGLKLLEASLQSKKVLTTVFLGNACSGLKG